MEECGRGAAVEQLTARGMEYQSPRWGAIAKAPQATGDAIVSIPAMGGNSAVTPVSPLIVDINPRDGGQ